MYTPATTKSKRIVSWLLPHLSSANVKAPQKVEALANKKVVQVAVGALHCLALTDNGEVSSWVQLFICLICTCICTQCVSRCIPGAIMNMDNRGMVVW